MFTSFELLQLSILSSFCVHVSIKHKYFILIQVFFYQLLVVRSESALPSNIYKSKEITTPEPSDFQLLYLIFHGIMHLCLFVHLLFLFFWY